MSLKAVVPVRLKPEMEARLRAISENTGISVAHLIRIATEQYLTEIESRRSITFNLNESGAPYRVKKPS